MRWFLGDDGAQVVIAVGVLHAAPRRIRACGYLLVLPDGRTLDVKWAQDTLVDEHDSMLGWT